MRAHLDLVLDVRLDLWGGLFGAGARHVSKRDERLAVLRGEIEPIGVTVHTKHAHRSYVADLPHGDAPCLSNLSSTIRRHAARSLGDHAVIPQRRGITASPHH